MRFFLMGLWLWCLWSPGLFAQTVFPLQGHVTDDQEVALPGATVYIRSSGSGVVTDERGRFAFPALREGIYHLEISYIGYQTRIIEVEIPTRKALHIRLVPDRLSLSEVVVIDTTAKRLRSEQTLAVEYVDETFIRKHLSGNLMKTLDRLPGVDAIGIGSGQSKPVIRGMGFNRVLVMSEGMRHESQQWGADHGLEVDQFAVADVEIIKGPASLMYGSDAIGGVIDLRSDMIPASCSVSGTIAGTYNSNNNLFGGSLNAALRRTKFYFSVRGTWLDYGDYRVPASEIDIYGYRAKLYKGFLRNTAGGEKAGHLTFGFIGKSLTNKTNVSLIHQKQGFFANAHGLEPRRVDTLLHDASQRDIMYPYQDVAHLSMVNKTEIFGANYLAVAEIGFQHNLRDEFSNYVSHGYMPPVFPDGLPFASDLERSFEKYTGLANLRVNWLATKNAEITTGVNLGYQDNKIDGRGFVIPAFRQSNAGLYTLWKQKFSIGSSLQAGLRFDAGQLRTDAYTDWFKSPVDALGQNMDFVERAEAIERNYSMLTWSVGYSSQQESLDWKINLGKSFRMPIAKELTANGVNYHQFSYEIGNPDLKPETAYQLDLGFEWRHKAVAVGLTPFVSYFTNYIFLNPTPEHDYIYGAGNQVYYYAQSEVFRAGGEVHAHFSVHKNLRFGFIGDYVFSRQTNGSKKGFGLPFSPPPSVLLNAEYKTNGNRWLHKPYVSLDFRLVGAQNTIVPPEEPTPAYQLLSLAAGAVVKLKRQEIELSMQLQNLLNTRYFNHTSYYRLINVPEAGRSFVVTLSMPFSFNLDQKY